MKHQHHQEERYTLVNFLDFFPFEIFGEIRPTQEHVLGGLSDSAQSEIREAPTGTGKTAIGYAFLKGQEDLFPGRPLFYLVPNKTHVDQFKKQFPQVKVAYGRAEYPCLYYGKEAAVTAQESPCYMLKCKHRVDQETGEVEEAGAEPCPYFKAKYEAKQGGIVVATAAFYLYAYFFSRDKEESQKPAGIVIDECHKLADILRHSLSFEISDYHLSRSVELLFSIDGEVANKLEHFKKRMIYFVKKRSLPNTDLLLKENEVDQLIGILSEINSRGLMKKVRDMVRTKDVDRETLKRLQDITYGIGRYIRSLKYAVPTNARYPLSYMYGYVKEEMGENDKVKYRLCIRSYHVSGIVRSMLEGIRTLSYSATIGNVEILKQETGLPGGFEAVTSDFSSKNTRIFLPSDTVDLSFNNGGKRDKTKTLRKIARTAKDFAKSKIRSLVLVVSDAEREKFMMLAKEEGLDVITYGNGVNSRQAVNRFKSGEGEVLVGTFANYGEGVDLPDGMAPVTFILRPDYPHPYDPMTQFEEERFGSRRWVLWTWRVIIKALQGRGRNIRSAQDKGVTFFMSSQFKKFLWASLPAWLRESYRSQITFEEAVKETKELLK